MGFAFWKARMTAVLFFLFAEMISSILVATRTLLGPISSHLSYHSSVCSIASWNVSSGQLTVMETNVIHPISHFLTKCESNSSRCVASAAFTTMLLS